MNELVFFLSRSDSTINMCFDFDAKNYTVRKLEHPIYKYWVTVDRFFKETFDIPDTSTFIVLKENKSYGDIVISERLLENMQCEGNNVLLIEAVIDSNVELLSVKDRVFLLEKNCFPEMLREGAKKHDISNADSIIMKFYK